MKLVVSAFVTVDGVVEAPGFDEHRDGRNAWALRVQDDETEDWNKQQVMDAHAILLGRVTYQSWAAFWPTSTADNEMTRRMNEIPKYVASNTLTSVDWANTTLLAGDAMKAVADLKAEPGGDLVVYGSPGLVDSLLKHDLVDEYRLSVYPVILGSGKHLFADRIDLHQLRLVGSRAFESGVVLLTYEPEQAQRTSRFLEQYAWTQEQVESLYAAQDSGRVLATVLFTDIVDSTGRAAAVGDREWRRLIDRHDELARAEVDRWNGTFVKSTGDGILATFDAPTRALRCAFALRDACADLGLETRAAIHTGEVEMRGGDVGGIGVHIASRALAEASAHQVVVTRTVRDLATGSDLSFTPLGAASLRGLPERWELFAADVRPRA